MLGGRGDTAGPKLVYILLFLSVADHFMHALDSVRPPAPAEGRHLWIDNPR